MTTVFWRKDDPDDFHVKDVNVPGVFPQPSSKINSYAVTTAVKPWLRPRRSGQTTQPPTSKHKPSTDMQGASSQNIKSSVIGEKSNMAAKGKASASLKDLSCEDKKRVANLIKELAKAGEERKLAVNALHQERSLFQGKEESLKRQQERLIVERDELREKILEYQFLINQYSKQIQHENEGLQVEEGYSISKENRAPSVKSRIAPEDGLIDSEGNIKPPLAMRELDEKIQTYYSVAKSTDPGYYREIGKLSTSSKDKHGCMEEKPREKDGVYLGAAEQNAHIISKDREIVDSQIINEQRKLKENVSQTYFKSPAEDIDDISKKQNNNESELEVQKTLIEQQNKLLEQQKVIQQQLEYLQMLQKNYTQEFSQIVTYSEGLKQVLNTEKRAAESSNQQNEMHLELTNSIASKEKPCNDNPNEELQMHTKNTSSDSERRMAAGTRDTSSNKHDSRENSHQQSTVHVDSAQQSKEQIINVDSHVSKSIEQIPGYLLHTNDSPLQHKSTSVVAPDDLLSSQSGGEKALMSSVYTMENSTVLKATAHQSRPSTSLSHLPHHAHSRKQPLTSPPISRLSYNCAHGDTLTSAMKAKATITNTDTKQHSLLQSLDDLEGELSNYDNDGDDYDDGEKLFIPGSYTGFARNILEGKFRNEQIFASTDYSDNESEPDDNDLIADMFFLKRS